MKTTNQLKVLIDIFFVISMIGLGIYLATMGYTLYQGISITEVIEEPSDLLGLRGTLVIMTFMYMIAFSLFTLAIFFLRKSIGPLIRKDYFHDTVSKNLKYSGRLFAVSGIGLLIVYMVTQMIKNSQIWIGINESVMALLFVIIMGLFISLLSEVFTHSRSIKEENDLTI